MKNARPHITLCMAVSLDGRISRDPDVAPDFTSRYDRHKLFRLRAESDALLIGANTVRQEQLPPLVRNEALREQRQKQGKPEHPAAVILSRSLDLPWDSDYFQKPKQEIWVITGKVEAPLKARLEKLHIHLIEIESESLNQGLSALREAGFEKILCEGGGSLNHSLLSENLIDTLELTIAPVIIAGENTPTLCKGPTLNPVANFRLGHTHVEGSELHLTYIKEQQ